MWLSAGALFQTVHESAEDDAASEEVFECIRSLSRGSRNTGNIADPLDDFYLKKLLTYIFSSFAGSFWQIFAQIVWTQLFSFEFLRELSIPGDSSITRNQPFSFMISKKVEYQNKSTSSSTEYFAATLSANSRESP